MAKHILEDKLRGFNKQQHPIGNPVGKAIKGYNDFLANEVVSEVVSGPLNKLWRAKILLDRSIRPLKQATSKVPTKSKDPKVNNIRYGEQPQSSDSSKRKHSDLLAHKKSLSTEINKSVRDKSEVMRIYEEKMWMPWSPDDIVSESQDMMRKDNRENLSKQLRMDNSIQIINFSADPIQYIQLQTIPTEVQHTSENTWAVINSMGRNLPMYHYTGSETSITFSISWYSEDRDNPDDVLVKCRLLEAWSKADGYVKSPPVLQVRWGSADVFKDQFFILVKADYKLSNWRTSSKRYDKEVKDFVNVGKQPGLQPSVATQELTFKRVSLTNLRHSDIVSSDMLKITNGIKYE